MSAWSRFWFTPIPPHSYALLRILFGILCFAALLGLRDIDTFWSLNGILPDEDYSRDFREWLATTGLGSAGPTAFYAANLAAFAAMAVGYHSGVAVSAAFFLALLHVEWNHLPLSGANQVIVGVLFCLIWADCGSVWSLDAWRARRRTRTLPPVPPPDYPIAPLRLLRFQIALIYLSTGLWKLYSPSWRDGSALHYIFNNNVFHRFPLEIPLEWEWMLTLGTYATLAWEIGFAFGLCFKATRALVLVVGVLMHMGMALAIEVGPFSFVMLAAYVGFLDPHRVAKLDRVIKRMKWLRSWRHDAHYHVSAEPQE